MGKRILTITLGGDWPQQLITMAKRVDRGQNVGEVLNFETPAMFFGRLTGLRWDIVRKLQGQGVMSLRELARRVERDVRRVHDDVAVLMELGLIEQAEGGIVCPFAEVHIDMHLVPQAA